MPAVPQQRWPRSPSSVSLVVVVVVVGGGDDVGLGAHDLVAVPSDPTVGDVEVAPLFSPAAPGCF